MSDQNLIVADRSEIKYYSWIHRTVEKGQGCNAPGT